MASLKPPTFEKFMLHAELGRYLRGLARARPDLCELASLGRSREGRQIWRLQITAPEGPPPEEKPGYLVHGNIHAIEVSGCTAGALTAWRLVSGYETEEEITELLRRVVFYIVPRLNPDGAEYALTTGGPIRSRTESRELVDGLQPGDVNGDGLVLNMRWEHPEGAWKPNPDDPRILLRRQPGDDGPFYQMTTEGLIHEWQGGPIRAGGRSLDFNRNFSANWQPEHVQPGAGNYPFSEPEIRALADFAYAHDNLFGMLGYHTGCNSLLRPPSTKDDEALDEGDVKVFKEIIGRGEELVGLKARSIRQYKSEDVREISLKGHFPEWAYEHLGLFVFEIELGNLWNSTGIETEEFFKADEDQKEEWEGRLLAWHEAHPEVGAFTEWAAFDHPQLGPVEVGGWNYVWKYNPSLSDLEELAPKCADFIVEHASRHPWLEISRVEVEHIEGSVYRIKAGVLNTGGLPTNITNLGAGLRGRTPVSVELVAPRGAEVLSSRAHEEIGQLGRAGGSREVEWFARKTGKAAGVLEIVARSQKAGTARREVRLQ